MTTNPEEPTFTILMLARAPPMFSIHQS